MITYKINTINLWDAFGFITGPDRSSSDTFLAEADPEDVYSHDWGIDGGIEYDNTAPVISKPRVFLLEGYMIASGESDFNTKYSAFKALLKSGALVIECTIDNTSIIVNARLKGWVKFRRLSSLSEDGVEVELGVEFNEVLTSSITSNTSVRRTVETYAAMVLLRQNEVSGIVYEYTVKSDETNGGVIGHYTSFNGNLTFFVEGDAI